jgi:hypothetical protein
MASRMTTEPAPTEAPINVQPTIDATSPPPPAPAKPAARKTSIRTASTGARRSVRRILMQAIEATNEAVGITGLSGSPPPARRNGSRSRSPPRRSPSPASPPPTVRIVNVYSPVPPMSPAECDALIAFYQQQKATLQAQEEAAIIVVSSSESTPDHAARNSSQPE